MSLRAVVFTAEGRLESVGGVLRQFGWEATESKAERDVLERVERRSTDLVIIGPTPGYNRTGLALTLAVRSRDPQCPVLLFTECSSEEFAIDALRAGANDLLIADTSQHEIVRALDRLSSRCEIVPADDGAPLLDGDKLIGRSLSARNVRESIARAARSDSNVLITGETGTGKELVAELIHRNSTRAKRPMVCINCAAIPETLLESELFGYERGAFTGAQIATPGKLEQAEGGTVFFDEIGDMSSYAQAKILRAIESREIHRLGGRRPIRLNVRVISATNRDLDELAMEDLFRKDLYFRINVARVHIEPLRERKSDIPPLIEHYVREFNRTFRTDVRGMEPETLDRLTAYHWPGNVRELRNVIESVFVSRPSPRITFTDLPEWLRRRLGEPASPDEQQRILSALAATNWNKSKAAEQLQWSRMTLYRKMAKYGI